jgi:ABC-type oligopeptide transport system substrate-binding subunit
LSTSHGLEPITPTARNSTTSNLLDLVFRMAEKEFTSMRREGSHVFLERRSGSSMTNEELARRLIHPALVRAVATPTGVDAELDGAPDLDLDSFFLDDGEYEQASFEPGKLTLKRKTNDDTITVINMTEEEEWRRFLAREVDLVPETTPNHVEHLRDVPSVRIVPVEDPETMAIIFNVRRGPASDPRLRRAVSLGLRRRSLAFVVDGEPVPADEDLAQAEALVQELPSPEITMLVHDASADLQRVGLVLQEQLAQIGLHVRLKPVSLAEIVPLLLSGNFECQLFYGSYKPRWWPYLSANSRGNYMGYASAAFEDAAERNDVDTAMRILRQDVPLVPLFIVHEQVAMDRRLCGAHPYSAVSLDWLAKIHLCKPGEDE